MGLDDGKLFRFWSKLSESIDPASKIAWLTGNTLTFLRMNMGCQKLAILKAP